MTIKTFLLSGITLAALSDELEKIALAKKPDTRKDTFKKFLRSTAVIGSGAGLGYGTGTAIDLALQKALGKRWDQMIPNQKMRLLGAGLGLASAGVFATREWHGHERKEALK